MFVSIFWKHSIEPETQFWSNKFWWLFMKFVFQIFVLFALFDQCETVPSWQIMKWQLNTNKTERRKCEEKHKSDIVKSFFFLKNLYAFGEKKILKFFCSSQSERVAIIKVGLDITYIHSQHVISLEFVNLQLINEWKQVHYFNYIMEQNQLMSSRNKIQLIFPKDFDKIWEILPNPIHVYIQNKVSIKFPFIPLIKQFNGLVNCI